jgi:hypothetical protein
MASGVAFYWIESKRRRAAEDAIFKEIAKSLNAETAHVDRQKKVVDAFGFLLKRSKFHRQLIDALESRFDDQEVCFAEFGSFISHLINALPVGSVDDAGTQRRLEKLREHLRESKKAYCSVVLSVENQEATPSM